MKSFLFLLILMSLFLGGCSSAKKEAPTKKTLFRHMVGSPEPREMTQVQGIDLSFSDPDKDSQKPVILCLHAIGHGGRDFQYFREAFSADYRIITLDWPGQGFSADDPKPASVTRYAELLEGVIENLKLEKLVLFGNSIGGGAAIKYASSHPEKVQGLILSNPAGLDKGGVAAKGFLWVMEGRFKRGEKLDYTYQPWFAEYYKDILITPKARDERDFIVQSAYEIAPVLTDAWHSFADQKNDLRSYVKKVEAPVLVAWASRDKYVTWDRNKEAVRKFPKRLIKQYPAGHAPFLETPERFNPDAKEFLTSLKLEPIAPEVQSETPEVPLEN